MVIQILKIVVDIEDIYARSIIRIEIDLTAARRVRKIELLIGVIVNI